MFSKLAAIAVVTVVALTAGVEAQEPALISGNPVIRWLCPLKDKSDYALGQVNYAYSSTQFFCSYPAEEGQDPFDYYCLYDQKKGSLAVDKNVGLCPRNGFKGPAPRKRSIAPVRPAVQERDMSDSMKAMRAVKRTGQKQRMNEVVKKA
ncbi:hypothetical protein P389DRAFT_33468 [Cystobasidium minutum MCA 4210]|uniref:uncharacterized protein n=1 Tax=Cystobasidium minutum MCA 4210 TaxID=1397322 RepID=UPI0034CF8E26|eukprot:jgi/Rhomi1/33468/CE33467_73